MHGIWDTENMLYQSRDHAKDVQRPIVWTKMKESFHSNEELDAGVVAPPVAFPDWLLPNSSISKIHRNDIKHRTGTNKVCYKKKQIRILFLS